MYLHPFSEVPTEIPHCCSPLQSSKVPIKNMVDHVTARTNAERGAQTKRASTASTVMRIATSSSLCLGTGKHTYPGNYSNTGTGQSHPSVTPCHSFNAKSPWQRYFQEVIPQSPPGADPNGTLIPKQGLSPKNRPKEC